jgi:hypothetical protein
MCWSAALSAIRASLRQALRSVLLHDIEAFERSKDALKRSAHFQTLLVQAMAPQSEWPWYAGNVRHRAGATLAGLVQEAMRPFRQAEVDQDLNAALEAIITRVMSASNWRADTVLSPAASPPAAAGGAGTGATTASQASSPIGAALAVSSDAGASRLIELRSRNNVERMLLVTKIVQQFSVDVHTARWTALQEARCKRSACMDKVNRLLARREQISLAMRNCRRLVAELHAAQDPSSAGSPQRNKLLDVLPDLLPHDPERQKRVRVLLAELDRARSERDMAWLFLEAWYANEGPGAVQLPPPASTPMASAVLASGGGGGAANEAVAAAATGASSTQSVDVGSS